MNIVNIIVNLYYTEHLCANKIIKLIPFEILSLVRMSLFAYPIYTIQINPNQLHRSTKTSLFIYLHTCNHHCIYFKEARYE